MSGIMDMVFGSDAPQQAADTQAKAATDAAAISAKASTEAIAEQKRQFDILQANQQPWLQAGTNALNQIKTGNLENFNVNTDPGAAFRFNEGMKGLNATAAARGGLMSGNALRAATQYGQDMGSQEYQNAYNRVAGIAGVGQSTANNLGVAGQNYANAVGNLGMTSANNSGNALMTGAQARASAYSQPSSFNQLLNTAGQAANIYGIGNAAGLWGSTAAAAPTAAEAALTFL